MSDCSTPSEQIVQLYHEENSEMMTMSALYTLLTNSLQVNMSLYSDTLSQFRASQSLLLYLMLWAWQRSSKNQFHNRWFDLTDARKHDLPYLMGTMRPQIQLRWTSTGNWPIIGGTKTMFLRSKRKLENLFL